MNESINIHLCGSKNLPFIRGEKRKTAIRQQHTAVRKNDNFPYVGIIQIRLWVKAIQLTLSLFTQAPLVLIFLHCSTMTRRSQEKGSAVTVFFVTAEPGLNLTFLNGSAD